MSTDASLEKFLNQTASYYSKTPSEWEFSQMFGEDEESEGTNDNENWISSLAFDSSGRFLAVGYNCGQVVVLTQQEDQTYQLYTEFKSHESEFDFLTSMEIEEKINTIKWFPYDSGTQHLMTANDKTIKLFKMFEHDNDGTSEVIAKPKKVYEGAHAYNINSVAFNSDGETFISADDLRINLWNININKEAFGIVDIKPENMDELNEVITCCDFHPKSCNILIYATSKGTIRMGDLRDSALCDRPAKQFEDTESDIGGFFQELVTTISDVKFSPVDGMFIVSRDYLTIKIWDPRLEKRPYRVIKFHDHLIPKLCDLYENDSIFDKFECTWNGNSSRLLTGSYNNNFYICDAFGSQITQIMAMKPTTPSHVYQPQQLDASLKVLHTAWHPHHDIVALGAKDFGYLYVRKTDSDPR